MSLSLSHSDSLSFCVARPAQTLFVWYVTSRFCSLLLIFSEHLYFCCSSTCTDFSVKAPHGPQPIFLRFLDINMFMSQSLVFLFCCSSTCTDSSVMVLHPLLCFQDFWFSVSPQDIVDIINIFLSKSPAPLVL